VGNKGKTKSGSRPDQTLAILDGAPTDLEKTSLFFRISISSNWRVAPPDFSNDKHGVSFLAVAKACLPSHPHL
jgi:hypothetical protein